jgi:hypothetical protein
MFLCPIYYFLKHFCPKITFPLKIIMIILFRTNKTIVQTKPKNGKKHALMNVQTDIATDEEDNMFTILSNC